MARRKTSKAEEFLSSLKDSLKDTSQQSIPDIITFVEDERYLGLPYGHNPIYLFAAQKLILKAFYRGSTGNENLEITEEDYDLCRKLGLTDHDNRGNLIEKIQSAEVFRELVLVWGRRSGKDFVGSIIAAYEAMKLLEISGGDPYAYYNIGSAVPISILTVATAKPQARIAFQEIREKVIYSRYFQDKYISEGIESEAIYLLTPKDKQDNKEFAIKGLPLKKGSVCIEVGHSNSDSLLGKGCIVLILDEVASYKTTGGASSGDRIYTALQPTLNTYYRRIPVQDEFGNIKVDEDGKTCYDIDYHGKIISISSPRGKEGKFFDLFEGAIGAPERIACRLPTWEVNNQHTYESLRSANSEMSEEGFMMEFGAEFSGTAGESFFERDHVEKCFKGHTFIENRAIGEPGKVYFAHLDPATNSHNYALVVLHKEMFINRETKQSDYYVVVDHIKTWHPEPNKPIDIDQVDEYMIHLKRRFHLGVVTYDHWNSQQSILRLRKHGIPARMTRFNRYYKMEIYSELESLVNSGRIKIPYHTLLHDEMISLQRKYTDNGFKVYAQQEGDGCHTDDIVDALAGAAFTVMSIESKKLPMSKLIYTGNPSSATNNIAWRNMQGGVYGVGSGQSVANALERRNSWPRYKR